MVLRNFLDEKVFFLHVVIVLTCFQSKKSQNKLYFMRSFLLKRLIKLAKISLREGKAWIFIKKSRLSNFEVSFCLNLYQSTILHLVKTFRIKTLTKSIKIVTKACNHERIISSNLKLEVDASLNITCRKCDDYILHNKIVSLQKFWLIGSKARRHWNWNPKTPLYSCILSVRLEVLTSIYYVTFDPDL